MRVLILCLIPIVLNGCSLVQWLPSSDCSHVRYERVGSQVEVEASCQV